MEKLDYYKIANELEILVENGSLKDTEATMAKNYIKMLRMDINDDQKTMIAKMANKLINNIRTAPKNDFENMILDLEDKLKKCPYLEIKEKFNDSFNSLIKKLSNPNVSNDEKMLFLEEGNELLLLFNSEVLLNKANSLAEMKQVQDDFMFFELNEAILNLKNATKENRQHFYWELCSIMDRLNKIIRDDISNIETYNKPKGK